MLEAMAVQGFGSMMGGYSLFYIPPVLLYVAIFWELIWKGIALWKTGRYNQMGWFIAVLLINSLGILPIIYLLFFQKKEKMVFKVKRVVSKKVKKIVSRRKKR